MSYVKKNIILYICIFQYLNVTMTEVKNIEDITQQSNSNNTSKQKNNTNSQGCIYDKYGRSPDGQTICGIGLPSAGADNGTGYQKCVFENKCPHCGNATLRWGWHWEENNESAFAGEGGNAEGHFFCYQGDGGCDADYSAQGHEHINGSNFNMTMISGPTQSNEKEAQLLIEGKMPCDGSLPQTVSSEETSGSSGVSISDKTFYGLIKQIIGAIDGVFIIANNMAYLLSFKDFYEYRDLYDKYVPVIDRKDVLDNSLVRNWTTDGYYNSVEVTYADGIIKYQNDALVQQYGENTFYYNFPDDDEETAKAKADALLGAHIRDYSTEIQLSIFYNENIIAGSWVKLHKSLSQLSGKTHREILQDAQKKTKKFSTRHNGIDITNLVEKTITQDNITKTIQTITDKEGNKFDIEIDKSEYELFFVQSYTCRWDKDNALIMDLTLKYGPDTPEDPVNATISTGQAMSNSGGGQSTGGMYGSDCFGAYSSSVSGFTENPPSDLLQGRANQNAQYAKDVAGKTPEEAFNFMNSKFPYCYYSDNCSTYKCVTDWYDSNPPGANCADSACLIVSVMNSIGVKACVVHVPGHYFNQIELNGKWVTCDMVDSRHSKDNSNTAGFPENFAGGRVDCPCASNGGRTS